MSSAIDSLLRTSYFPKTLPWDEVANSTARETLIPWTTFLGGLEWVHHNLRRNRLQHEYLLGNVCYKQKPKFSRVLGSVAFQDKSRWKFDRSSMNFLHWGNRTVTVDCTSGQEPDDSCTMAVKIHPTWYMATDGPRISYWTSSIFGPEVLTTHYIGLWFS